MGSPGCLPAWDQIKLRHQKAFYHAIYFLLSRSRSCSLVFSDFFNCLIFQICIMDQCPIFSCLLFSFSSHLIFLELCTEEFHRFFSSLVIYFSLLTKRADNVGGRIIDNWSASKYGPNTDNGRDPTHQRRFGSNQAVQPLHGPAWTVG